MRSLSIIHGSAVLAVLLAQQGCVSLSRRPVLGTIERADRSFIRGWAGAVDNPSAAVQVRLYATGVSTAPRFGDRPRFLGEVTADEAREPYVAEAIGDKGNHGLSLPMPAMLLDGRDHDIFACALPTAAPVEVRLGRPLTFNSNVLYRQEAVYDLLWNTQVFYTTEAMKADSALQNGFLKSDLNSHYAAFNTGHTQFAMFGQGTNPVPMVVTGSLRHLTGLDIPPAHLASCQIGVEGGPEKGTNALQAYGTALGACLAPRALTDRPFIHGVFGLYNWADPVALFARSPDDRLRVEGFFRHPYTSVKPVGEGLIAQEGAVFFYYTLQFRDTTQNRDLWFVVRLYQDKFARPTDPWTTLMDHDALAVDGTNPATSIGLIDTILRPGTTRVTPVSGSASFSLTPFSGERYVAFEVSGKQFRQALKDLNAAKVAHVLFSENPSDYQLKHYNINVESWAPSLECDPRIGLSWRDITLSMVPADAS